MNTFGSIGLECLCVLLYSSLFTSGSFLVWRAVEKFLHQNYLVFLFDNISDVSLHPLYLLPFKLVVGF